MSHLLALSPAWIRSPRSFAAFANNDGGTLVLGVADSGELVGHSPADVTRLNQLVSNAASHRAWLA